MDKKALDNGVLRMQDTAYRMDKKHLTNGNFRMQDTVYRMDRKAKDKNSWYSPKCKYLKSKMLCFES